MLDDIRQALKERIERHRKRPFLEAFLAGCALVATADGVVSFSERSRIDDILDRIDILKLFDVHDAVDLLDADIRRIEEDGDEGREALFSRVEKMTDDPEAAELLIRLLAAVSVADGTLDGPEKFTLSEICTRLDRPLAEIKG